MLPKPTKWFSFLNITKLTENCKDVENNKSVNLFDHVVGTTPTQHCWSKDF